MSFDEKTALGPLDGKPGKRLFWSIVNDYSLRTAICELIDNSIDTWMIRDRQQMLEISIDANLENKSLLLMDNAGGVSRENLRLLISPGSSNNLPGYETIGIFGVGSKRAVVALSEKITIRTRYNADPTFQIDIDREWLSSDSWDIPYYGVPDISSGATEIEMSMLRYPLTGSELGDLVSHIRETYAKYISPSGCNIFVNGTGLTPIFFDSWAFPPEFGPKSVSFELNYGDAGILRVEILAGLISDRNASEENYGVYFYCNGRLIAKHIKDKEVGYQTGLAGIPHPDASLCRVLVFLNGPAQLMPWNSNKTGINYASSVFQSIRESILVLLQYYTSLSRRFRTDRYEKVYRYTDGDVEKRRLDFPQEVKRITLPPLPKVRKNVVQRTKEVNKKQFNDQPWTVGLVEGFLAVDVIVKQRFDTGNRIALLLLDSVFEVSLKEYIVNNEKLFPGEDIKTLFKKGREAVIDRINSVISIDPLIVGRVKYFYRKRNQLVHERATVDVPNSDIDNYKDVVRDLLKQLFDLSVD